MPSLFTNNPFSYNHDVGRTYRNIRYGPYDMQRLNVYLNPTRLSGGNPVLAFSHGGAWTGLDKTSTIEGDRVVRLLFSYLLDSDNGEYPTSTVPFDIVSIEQRIQGHKLSAATMTSTTFANTPYEPIIEGTNPGYGPGTGTISGPWYERTQIDDIQNAYQWIKDNADRFGWDARKVVAGGYSAGAMGAMCAAFSPSRQYTTRERSTSRWDRFSNSKVLGVINWVGEIDINPWFTAFTVTEFIFGTMESVSANSRADMEKFCLIPDSSGNYTSTSVKTPLCKSLSPVDLIARELPENSGVKIRSHYQLSDQTSANVTTYSSIPPYDKGGHDQAQYALLDAHCATYGIDHSGSVVDDTGTGPGYQLAWEGTLAGDYAWLSDLVDF